MSMQIAEPVSEARLALERACEHLLSLQDAEGWWKGELQTNVTMDAEDMLLREFLGIRESGGTARSAEWIRSQQRADGTWANFYGGPGDLSTTIEAYWALRLAGDEAEAEHMRAAAAFIRAEGGIERARVFTHVWLALFGLWSWEQVPALPPEIVLLGAWVPLNIYDFACWARQTIVALSVVIAHRPHHPLPFSLEELRGAHPWRPAVPQSARGRWLTRLDRVLRAYERRPPRLLRRLALGRAERWIVRRQEADGSWGGIQPPWVYSLMALRLGGYPLEHPLMRRGIEGIDTFMVESRAGGGAETPGAMDSSAHNGSVEGTDTGATAGPSRRLEACQSPVWDTALAMVALSDAGLAGDHEALVRAGEWLVGEEVGVTGDWHVARPGLNAGGWAFEFANDNYPDVDDTAEVVLALLRLEDDPHARARPAIDRALAWTKGMQSRDGGWGAFDADNTRALVRELPFLDFGEVIDEPSADVTAHAVEMLAALGLGGEPGVERAVRWLRERQEPDGSWWGRWGVNHVYGTGAVVPALIAAGVEPSEPCIRSAVKWLKEHQNEDGGWGEDPRSYDSAEWVGRGPSTASQTAWALLALHAAGEAAGGLAERRSQDAAGPSPVSAGSRAVERGVAWLVQSQREDGGWDEPQYTGTGFPSDYYINYHLYRLVFPVMALGRCLGRRAG
ncbi:MAG: squalene--hopene cyclase [Solirubrobacteraceae bacterium]